MASQLPNSAHALLDRDIQRLDQVAQGATAEGDVRFVRIAGWLIAGNAGALLLCFNALLEHRICDWSAFNPLVLVFVAGLGCAFASVFFDWFAVLFRADHMRKLTRSGELVQMAWIESDGLRERLSGLDEAKRSEVNARLADLEKEVASQISEAGELTKRSWLQTALTVCAAAAIGLSTALLASGVYESVSDPKYLAAVCE
jgi:hypothetical protein